MNHRSTLYGKSVKPKFTPDCNFRVGRKKSVIIPLAAAGVFCSVAGGLSSFDSKDKSMSILFHSLYKVNDLRYISLAYKYDKETPSPYPFIAVFGLRFSAMRLIFKYNRLLLFRKHAPLLANILPSTLNERKGGLDNRTTFFNMLNKDIEREHAFDYFTLLATSEKKQILSMHS